MNATFEKLRAILDETDERYRRLIVISESGAKRPTAGAPPIRPSSRIWKPSASNSSGAR